jgi:hypothetical protein
MPRKKYEETQVHNPKSDTWIIRDEMGRFKEVKKGEPFKNIPKENDENEEKQ